MSRKELKTLAKSQLKGRWGKAALVTLLFFVVILVVQGIFSFVNVASNENILLFLIGYILIVLVLGVLSIGYTKYSLNFTDTEKKPMVKDLFEPAPKVIKILGLNVAIGIIVIIGTILLIVPGIIASFALSQSVFIFAEDPNKSIKQCLKESCSLMKGHKWEYFVLSLSFIGWIIVAMFTLYVGFLWLYPYMMVTYSNYYLSLKKSE